jgi:anthranilate synthase component I
MLLPSLDEVKKSTGAFKVVPVSRAIIADTETPVSVWMKLYKIDPCSFLLESVAGAEHVSRYSFIGGNPFCIFRARGQAWEITGDISDKGSGDPLHRLRALMAAYTSAPLPGLPRFCGGAVGYCAYDAVRLWERLPDRHRADGPGDDIFFGLYKTLVVFDNLNHRMHLVTNIFMDTERPLEDLYRDAGHTLGEMEDRLAVRLASARIKIAAAGEIQSNFQRAAYEAAVDKCKEYIRAGDIFQVVLSQRFSLGVETDPFDLYRMVRMVNPSPYMYYLACDGYQIIGASPEMMVRVENGTAEVRPIAGTSRRGTTETEDAALAEALLADPKEVAEHVMLVDLGRNDIGRISRFGSVTVEEMMHIERYSHVMHIVSNVHGVLKEGLDALDVLKACFPAGTLSGAPKIRAMEIIDELETVRRGTYGGALGYIGFNGTLDTCIVIRTILFHNGQAFIQAGAGIVADSVPAREYDESVNKARALFTAIAEAGRIIGG